MGDGLSREATNPILAVEAEPRAPEGTQHEADVIVVGAGPAGSSAAYWLATCGLDVLVLENSVFPRAKVCGDGITPRGTRALVDLGIDVGEEDGWVHTRGLRVVVGERHLEVDWPELTRFPGYGLVRKRADLDRQLVEHAAKAGARLHQQTKVTGSIQDQQGRVVGVTAKTLGGVEVRYRAPLVLACDGASGRLAIGLGLHQRRTVGALVVGFAGLVLVAGPGGGGSGAMLSLLAALAITGGTLLARRLRGLDVIVASGWHFVIGGAALAVLAAVVEGAPVIAWTPRFVTVLAFVSVVGSAAAFVAWFTEALRSRLDVLSAWTFLTPVFGIALAAVVLGERPSGWSAAGLAAVLVAMGVVLRPGPRLDALPSAPGADMVSGRADPGLVEQEAP